MSVCQLQLMSLQVVITSAPETIYSNRSYTPKTYTVKHAGWYISSNVTTLQYSNPRVVP